MSALTGWLAQRRPAAPPDLAAALAGLASGERQVASDRASPPSDTLARAGADTLARAYDRPGRVRESAFRLLEADALLTFACEAALESADSEDSLVRILATVSG